MHVSLAPRGEISEESDGVVHDEAKDEKGRGEEEDETPEEAEASFTAGTGREGEVDGTKGEGVKRGDDAGETDDGEEEGEGCGEEDVKR
jgi:hypothetical protein